MTQALHFRRLESMYQAAPINEFYRPDMQISEAEASITIEVDEKHHHSGGGVHGSVYFKMLDDAAFFAANSLEEKVFVLTTSFTTYLTRPVAFGKLTAKGKVVNRNKSQFIAEAVLYDEQDNEIGRGNGIFVRGKLPLTDARGYLSYEPDGGKSGGQG
ncbi:PaaI family thioesterase [Thalassomonas viridans]|uniref:PaaI family thioesterase n=1 Tax=Thalassomonas viridans TaxID=137584 RepID=A0AAF0C5A5_9GAMM|nr:PaaI family thioesterase [Thalassomonas viridans]WDE03117.1 PaaI family thioesterase [Thalassomonas viridans]